jgi:hypothetical protein
VRRPLPLAVAAVIVVALGTAPASAQDKTLSEGRPLVHLGDAFPIGPGDGAVLAGAGVTLQRASPNRGFFPLELQYSLLPQTQFSLSTTLSSHPHAADDPRAGDLTASVTYNFGRETVVLPSFAANLSVTAPTGVGSTATSFELKFYATKSLTDSLFLHVNAAGDVADRIARDERRARYHLALGSSYTLPEVAAVLVAADVFTDQSSQVGESNATGLEVGVRVRVTPAIYWDAGIGSELIGGRDRATLFVSTGVTIGFSIGD